MNWFDWVLVGWFVLGTLATVGTVGRRREPVTPLMATSTVALNALLIVGVVKFG